MNAGGNGSGIATAEAPVRCHACGRLSGEPGRCTACGETWQPVLSRDLPVPGKRPEISRRPLLPIYQPRQSTPPAAPRLQAADRNPPWPRHSDHQVSGRVVVVHQAPQEPMDFDPWRWVAIPAWGLLLLSSPLCLLIVVWQAAGFLPALVAAVVTVMVLRFLFSNRLLQTWHLTAALNGRYIVEPMPVVMMRLRDVSGNELQMRLKGRLQGGTPIEGDRILASGSWWSGVLHAKRIECQRTGAVITPVQPHARRLALTGLGLLGGVGLWLLVAGVPWVSSQMQSFHSSVQQSVQTTHPNPQAP